MSGLLWILPALALGCLFVHHWLSLLRPRWLSILLLFGAGTPAGIGITSCLFYLSVVAAPRIQNLSMWIEMALLGGLAYAAFRKRQPPAAHLPALRFPLNALLIGSLLIAAVAVTTIISGAWEANPHGNWDAWTLWNLRARFLAAGGELAQRAWSPMLASHPEYPLLVSAFVGRCWAYGQDASTAVPIATSYLYLLSLLALMIGGIGLLRSQSLGLLAGLALLGTPTLLHEVPAQYADVPITCYFAGAIVLMLLDYPLLAGLCASMAAWTKDEGLLFLVLLCAAATAFRRRDVPRLIMGALPVTFIFLGFKALLHAGTPSILGNSVLGLVPKLEDPSRYGQVIGAFGSEFVGMASGWYHPLLPVLVLAIVLRFDRERHRDLLFCATVAGSLMLAYFATYIITPYDLTWHLQSSLDRIFVQLWPCLLLAVFAGLRRPEALARVAIQPTAEATPDKIRKKKKTPGRR